MENSHLAGADATDGRITVSIVSHGHSGMVERLLHRLCETHGGWIDHCVVTHNLPAPALPAPAGGWPFNFTQIFNQQPAGFGANHNNAFASCGSEFFCILNPDIELPGPQLWEGLVRQAQRPGTGLAYPVLLNPDGSRQDNERESLTPLALVERHLLKRPTRRLDWVSAAFWLVPSHVYRQLGGFDESFYMYCEDIDFCLRLRLGDWQLRRADVTAVHHAVRRSRRPSKHFAWHVRSLMRLWTGSVLWRYQAWLRAG